MSKVLELTKELISKKSVTPDDAGCQSIISTRLKKIGFSVEHLRFGDVDNLWATYGDAGPIFAFLGHTDVVPTCLLYTSPSPRDRTRSRMPSSA